MNSGQKTYYKYLDIIRIICCLDILLYHLNIVDGGCLAVCSFFVLSGYLSCITSFRKEKFSLLEYYKNRLLKIYLPIAIVTFITIFVISFFDNIIIINLKQEVFSILFGYNNFWQLNANFDYFAQHINSPFMHLWYVAILIQYELIWPFIFIFLKKLGDSKSEAIPFAATFALGTISAILFYKLSLDSSVMNAYYNSFVRAFSWLFGISLGFVHSYYKNPMFKNFKDEKAIKIIFFSYVLVLLCLFILVDEMSDMLAIAMFIATILTVTLIDYGVMLRNRPIIENHDIENSRCYKMIQTICKLSYKIYLVQYPIIYIHDHISFFDQNKILNFLKLISILFFIAATSLFIHFGLHKNKRNRKFFFILLPLIIILSASGIYKFIIAKDYSEEMNASKIELEENRILMEQKQKDFQTQNKIKYIANISSTIFKDFETEKENLAIQIKNMPLIGIGDSVMLGAVNEFYETFPNIYIDAKVSRTVWNAFETFENLIANDDSKTPFIINLGSNGDCSEKTKDALMQLMDKRELFWITNTNDKVVKMNAKLKEYAKKHNNLHIIDWETYSKGHNDYFAIDGIHLTKTGRNEYTKFVFNSIFNFYVEKLTAEKQAKMKELLE